MRKGWRIIPARISKFSVRFVSTSWKCWMNCSPCVISFGPNGRGVRLRLRLSLSLRLRLILRRLLRLILRLPMSERVPLWWQAYVTGRSAPSHFAAVAETEAGDPASTFAERFMGDPVSLRVPPDRRLVWRAGFFEPSYLRRLSAVDYDGVSLETRRVLGRFLLAARLRGIPLVPIEVAPRSFQVIHLRYIDYLEPDEWLYLGRMCVNAARDVEVSHVCDGLFVVPGALTLAWRGVPVRNLGISALCRS